MNNHCFTVLYLIMLKAKTALSPASFSFDFCNGHAKKKICSMPNAIIFDPRKTGLKNYQKKKNRS